MPFGLQWKLLGPTSHLFQHPTSSTTPPSSATGLPVRLPGSDYSAALAAKERLIAALMPEMRDAHAAMLKRWEAAGRSGPALAAALLEEQERQREAAREAEARGQKATPPDLSIKEAMLTAYFIGGWVR